MTETPDPLPSIVIGADHAGVKAKDAIASFLRGKGFAVEDVGTSSDASVDYPDFARLVGEKVAFSRGVKGILVCGTGIGMAISANKVPGVRAAVVWSDETARLASAHNNANVLCLSGRLFPAKALESMVSIWLATPFEEGRHVGRLEKIRGMEGRR